MDLKTALFGSLFAISATKASATTLFAPQACAPENMSLVVRNSAKSPETFWLQMHQGDSVREVRFDVEGKTESSWKGTDFLKSKESFFVKHFSADGNLMFLLKCRGQWNFEETASPVLDFRLSGQNASLQFLIQNLDPVKNRAVHLRWRDGDGLIMSEESRDLGAPYASSEFLLESPAGARTLSIEGEGRLTARMMDLDRQRVLPGHLMDPARTVTQEETAYFLLSNAAGTESFVLPLSDPDLTAQAREIVAGQKPKILIAEIESTPASSENRNLVAEDRAPWSWHVRKTLNFTDVASIDCSGSPSLVEERLAAWLKHPNPRICFWSYFLKREISAEEVASGYLKNP